MTEFKVGDIVTWAAKAGTVQEREGEIVATVPKGRCPLAFVPFPFSLRDSISTRPRDHESYLVRSRGRVLFWPKVKDLRKVNQCEVVRSNRVVGRS